MNYLKQILAIALLFNASIFTAQQQAYVTADNGLTIREKPDISSEKLGKLDYGESIEITDNTNIELVILDEGEKIRGNWVKIKKGVKSGYVFNGYLTKEKITRGIEIHHTGLELKLKNLRSVDESMIYAFFDEDHVKVTVDLGDSPEGKTLIINNGDYKRVSIFQRFENSVSIQNEGPHCDPTEWRHYDSDWKPITKIATNKYKTLTYSNEEIQKFRDISIEKLKVEVQKKCGEDWVKYIENVKTINDYPASISVSRIFLKLILTDFNNNVTEKIITFEIPMGC